MRYAWQLLEEKKRPVITISPDDSALRAAQLMNDAHVGALVRNRRIRHVPVMDDARLIGMVSIGDLNIVTQRAQAETILYLEQYMYQA